MAMIRLGVVLVGTVISLFLLMQLLMTGEDELPAFDANSSAEDDWVQASTPDEGLFLLGAGKADITGPVVEVGLNGYAALSQVGSGLRQRIYSRAFIVASPSNPENTFIYVVLDAHSGDTGIRHGVVEGLGKLGGSYARYGERNLALTGTHSHSGPGAWMNYLLPQIPSKGFDKQSHQALVDGALLSIQRAHDSLTPGRLTSDSIDLQNANINRSPYSYDANPEEEKARYSDNVDKIMTLLRFDRESDNKTMAVLSFFPVHGTSLYNNNTLITGDNKGVAAWLFERDARDDERFAEDFVAGFSQSNVGDTSPNVLGAWCEDGSGSQCRYQDSTCGGKTQHCRARGPFFREKDNGAKSCFEIGRLQYTAAKEGYEQMNVNGTRITGSSHVRSFHVYQNLSDYSFLSPFNSSTLSTCPAALGFSFAGGTVDGPGQFDFTQNGTGPAQGNPLWYAARAFIHKPTKEQQACQSPKNVLLDIGTLEHPYPWTANIVDIQVLRVGQFLMIVSASEATTMSGRRWKEAVAHSARDQLSIPEPLVVLGAPSNSYAHYVTTEEEYGVQRYEGASTLYGPNTLAAYVNLTLTYLPYLGSSSQVDRLPTIPFGPSPPINTNRSLSFIPSVVYDSAGIFKSFGETIESPPDVVYRPGDIVQTTFVGANPRNNLRLESTFATVEILNSETGAWETVRDDSDWNLLFRWERTSTALGQSKVTIQWQIEDDYYNSGNHKSMKSGTYRMRYYGDHKNMLGRVKHFEGTGGSFKVATS